MPAQLGKNILQQINYFIAKNIKISLQKGSATAGTTENLSEGQKLHTE